MYILSHPVFGKFYLGLSKGDKNKRGVHQRQLAHGGKLLGKFGKNITDAGAWAELRQEALAMGMDLYKDLFEKVKIDSSGIGYGFLSRLVQPSIVFNTVWKLKDYKIFH